MKSLTVYALGLATDKALRGSVISRVDAFFGGASVYLEGATPAIWHLLYLGRRPELFPSQDALVPPESCHPAFRQLEGGRISSVTPLEVGRLLVVSVLSSGDWGGSEEYLLRIDLSASGKAAALYSSSGGAIETLGSGRPRAAASAHESPAAKDLSMLGLPDDPPEGLQAAMDDVETDGVAPETALMARANRAEMYLLEAVDGLDPDLARAITRSQSGDARKIWSLLSGISRATSEADWSWGLYSFIRSREPILYPVELAFTDPVERYDDFREALAHHGQRSAIPAYGKQLKKRVTSAARKEIARIERIAELVGKDISVAERSKEFRHTGNLLVTYRHRIKRGMTEIIVQDFSGTENITVDLDPAKTPDQNIQLYFKKAKKGERGLMILRSRRKAVLDELAAKKRALEEIDGLEDPSALLPMLPGPARRGRRDQRREPDRFRRFKLEGGLIAYVGRSDAENDRLTHKFASPSDLWFHAQGISGSHVILKGADRSTPKRILEQAAAIAAFYSKARHSTTVPVIYAEKRYVRKPRNSKPGTAACQRGKTVFVHPALPEGQR